MKTKIITLLLIVFTINSYAQTDDFNCKFVAEIQNQCDVEFSASIDEADFDNFDPVVVNIFFWEIKTTQGGIVSTDHDPGWDFEKESLDVVAELNIKYNPFKIFFKYKGAGEIHNTELYNFNDSIEYFGFLNDIIENSGTPELFKKTNAINVYVDPRVSGGFATPFVPRYGLSRSTFGDRLNVSTHEVGHIFALLHTHTYWLNCIDSGLPPAFLAENVTRNTNDPNYNADVSGDRVPDTAASPNLKYQKCHEEGYTGPYYEDCPEEFKWAYIPNCHYTNDVAEDCTDTETQYNIPDDDIKNIMSYAKNECKSIFTVGQGIRMREAIETTCAEPDPSPDREKLQEAINPLGVASLYEPYKGDYYFAGPLPTIPPLFQPGFDYNFIHCDCFSTNDCLLPLDYLDTSFTYDERIDSFVVSKYESNYNSIAHPNHMAIDIPILNASQPWRCHDNNNRTPTSGTIIKFNDNVLNTNVTITTQDSLNINNENLINNLEPGLYNIIEQFENGDTEEQLIIKENN